jgi:hypothetical protein
MDRGKLDTAIADLVASLGGGATPPSVVLYGSAARGDWIPWRSDVNLLVVVDDPSPPALAQLTPAVTAWSTAGFTPPLIIGRAEWDRAADVFPIEITDMRTAYRVLLGNDPVAGLEVDESDLRRSVEAELRGTLIRLRQAYVRFSDSMPTLGGFATSSVATLLVLLRCTAVLLHRDGGKEPTDTIAALAAELGGGGGVVVEIAAQRREKDWSCPPELFARYLEVVRRAVDLVDHIERGDR